MRTFEQYNPIAVSVYFLATAGIAMFSMNPVILCLSLIGSILLYLIRNGARNGKSHLYTLWLFIIMTVINPLVNHNGVTVLFVINNNPVTLEALIYGIAASVMIVAVMYWFRSYSQIMTSDKLLYIFGSLSPKIALILSMTLRYVPLFGSQVKKVGQSQKALGLYKEDNIMDRFRGGVRIFSVMVTWALENGIITADSMTARGYGTGKRSRFSIFTFDRHDFLLTIFSIMLAVFTVYGLRKAEFTYYPAVSFDGFSFFSILGYISYGILILLPAFIEVKEALKWKYLKSKI